METKKCCYPGTFGPFHKGHDYVLQKGFELFDEVHLLFAKNPNKVENPLFLNASIKGIKDMYPYEIANGKLVIAELGVDELTSDYCKKNDIHYIIRGFRGVGDVGEVDIANNNRWLNNIDTILIPSPGIYMGVSSTFIRNIWRSVSPDMLCQLLPKEIVDRITEEFVKDLMEKS